MDNSKNPLRKPSMKNLNYASISVYIKQKDGHNFNPTVLSVGIYSLFIG